MSKSIADRKATTIKQAIESFPLSCKVEGKAYGPNAQEPSATSLFYPLWPKFYLTLGMLKRYEGEGQ